MGFDWFRQYLLIEFAEEGIDLLKETREMLERSHLKLEKNLSLADGGGNSRGGEGDGGGAVGDAGGEGGGGEGEGDDFDVRQRGKEIFNLFMKSGCGAECNLPGTVVKKVRRVYNTSGKIMRGGRRKQPGSEGSTIFCRNKRDNLCGHIASGKTKVLRLFFIAVLGGATNHLSHGCQKVKN